MEPRAAVRLQVAGGLQAGVRRLPPLPVEGDGVRVFVSRDFLRGQLPSIPREVPTSRARPVGRRWEWRLASGVETECLHGADHAVEEERRSGCRD